MAFAIDIGYSQVDQFTQSKATAVTSGQQHMVLWVGADMEYPTNFRTIEQLRYPLLALGQRDIQREGSLSQHLPIEKHNGIEELPTTG